MSGQAFAQAVALITWLALVAVILVPVLVLNRPRASAEAAFGQVGIKVTSAASQAARRYLELAAAARGRREGLSEVQQRLERTSRIRAARVLWVDDHPDDNLGEILTLRSLGLNVIQTLSSIGARSYVANAAFDLVITDLTGGGDGEAGVRFVRDMRRDGLRLPVIVYSVAPGEQAQGALAAGAAAAVSSPGELLGAVLSQLSPA